MSVKGVAILGSTGSNGTQALDVVEEQDNFFDVVLLTANNNYKLLIKQAKKFKPDFVVIVNDVYYKKVCEALSSFDIKVFSGIDAICDLVSEQSIDIVLTALVGYSGLKPTIAAINGIAASIKSVTAAVVIVIEKINPVNAVARNNPPRTEEIPIFKKFL